MTQRRRKRRSRFGRRAFLAGAGCAALAGAGLMLRRGQTVSALSVPAPEAEPNAALPAGEWRAVWVSYLEWAGMDFSSEEAFRAGAAALMDNCLSIGLNTVIVHCFSDPLNDHLLGRLRAQAPEIFELDLRFADFAQLAFFADLLGVF